MPSLGTRQQIAVAAFVVAATTAAVAGAGTSMVVPIPVVHDARRSSVAAGFAHRAGTSSVVSGTGAGVVMRQRSAILSLARVGVLLQGLQLRQRDYITVLRPVPDRLLRGHVVVVEPAGVGVEQFPPLGRVRPLDDDTLE